MQNVYQNIIRSLDFLREIINRRLNIFFNKEQGAQFIYPQLNIVNDDAPLNRFLHQYQLNIEEYTVLLLAIVPHIQPNFFENIIHDHIPQGGEFVEMGGVKGTNYRGMIPTGETAQFIIAGNDFEKRMFVQNLLQHESVLIKDSIVKLETLKEGEPVMSGRIMIDEEWLQKILFGHSAPPKFSPDFPASKITTKMEWKDLVLNSYTRHQIDDLLIWLKHNETLMKDDVLGKKNKTRLSCFIVWPAGNRQDAYCFITWKTIRQGCLSHRPFTDRFKIYW